METSVTNEIIEKLVNEYTELVERELKLKKLRNERELKLKKLRHENYFGNCSVCGRDNRCLNIGKAHYYVCHKHKKKWYVGSNLFSSWRDENEKIWKKNAKKIHKYDEIDGEEWRDNKIKKIDEEIRDKEADEPPF